MTKRSIQIIGKDSFDELPLSKVTCIKTQNDFEAIHLDKLPDDTWRLIYTAKTIEDIKQVDKFVIHRED